MWFDCRLFMWEGLITGVLLYIMYVVLKLPLEVFMFILNRYDLIVADHEYLP